MNRFCFLGVERSFEGSKQSKHEIKTWNHGNFKGHKSQKLIFTVNRRPKSSIKNSLKIVPVSFLQLIGGRDQNAIKKYETYVETRKNLRASFIKVTSHEQLSVAEFGGE